MKQKNDAVKNGDFTDNNLIEDEFVTVAQRKSSSKQWYAFGGNPRGGAGNLYIDFNDGTNPVTGEVRFVVYETDRLDEIKTIGDTYDLETLRAAPSDQRSEWEELSEQAGAETDEVIALEVRVDNTDNDGNSVDLTASDYKIQLQRYRA